MLIFDKINNHWCESFGNCCRHYISVFNNITWGSHLQIDKRLHCYDELLVFGYIFIGILVPIS